MDTSEDLELKSAIETVLADLPPPLHSFITEKGYEAATAMLGRKYALGEAQSHILERELLLLLMGIENPDEFASSLKADAQLSDDVVQNLMTDVNQEVFIPLQEEVRASDAAIAPPPPPLPPSPFPASREEIPKPPVPRLVTPPRVPQVPPPHGEAFPKRTSFAPPPQSPAYPAGEESELIFKTTQPRVHITQNANLSMPGVIKEGQRYVPHGPAAHTEEARGVTDAGHLLSDHEEEHIELHKKGEVPTNLPGALPPLAEEPPPVPLIPKVPRPQSPQGSSIPPLQSYTADPYREPIDTDERH